MRTVFSIVQLLNHNNTRITWIAFAFSALGTLTGKRYEYAGVYLGFLAIGLAVALLGWVGALQLRRRRPHLIRDRKALLSVFDSWAKLSRFDRSLLVCLVLVEAFLAACAGVIFALLLFYLLWKYV
jgi:hypothetical protein